MQAVGDLFLVGLKERQSFADLVEGQVVFEFPEPGDVFFEARELAFGGDLVGDLIERNQAAHACNGVEFRKLDLVNDALPAADVILCRDCLVHLSFDDAQSALANVARSGAKWLLTTSFPGIKRNDNIVTGQWRPINLTLPPFNFPEPKNVCAENCTETEFADKTLALWPVEQIA